MGSVFGDVRSLATSDRSALEKLSQQKSNPHELLSMDLAKRAGKICANLSVQIGLLIGRDGKVEQAILGARDRIYLPDLGRYRLSQARLRRLRLIVFVPEGQHRLKFYPQTEILFGSSSKRRNSSKSKESSDSKWAETPKIEAPEIAWDLLTDLDKLRLDSVVVIAVSGDGTPGPLTLAYIQQGLVKQNSRNPGAKRPPSREVGFFHANDLRDVVLDFEAFVEELETSFSAKQERGHSTGKDRAVLVGVYTGSSDDSEYSMAELLELARTAEIQVLDTVTQRRRELDPRTVLGKGKLEDIVLHCLDLGADLLIFDCELSPGQLRSITNLTELRVLDRSMLILDIFAQRAKSSEGRLQVELAQLKYALPRLTEKDTGLSRLSGGIGGRGPGETKLEIGRRRARDRIVDLEKRIERLAGQRGVRRERRQSRGVPVIAIVGYTNAGKSTLLNALTKGNVFAESKLFATLDPSSRRMRFPNEKEVIFVDTVGFIRDLPDELVIAFRATLEEVGQADILVHVVDSSNHEMKRQIAVVDQTLNDLGFVDKTRVLVLNKTDLLSPLEVKALENTTGAFAISAVTRVGLEQLVKHLQQELSKTFAGQDPGRFTEEIAWE